MEFPAIEVQAGEELLHLCQSFTLNNDEPLYVNAVHMAAGDAWHHSNWFFVPESVYDGPDGTWTCADRDWNELETALVGGVIFAQSTQASEETQRFLPGAAVVIPKRSRIVGQIHLLNLSEASVSTSIELEFETIAPDEMDTRLVPASMSYGDLKIPPLQRSRFTGTCDYSELYGGPLDFRVHYVLPHFHALGESLKLEAVGGSVDGQTIFESTAALGEPLGGVLDPPFDLTGASGMRFGCIFNNDRNEEVGWGFDDQEMCVVLTFVDASLMFGSVVDSGSVPVDTPDSVAAFEGPCLSIASAPR